ncbi:MAG: uroporphyrinogen decarboxylase family protein, partial [Candidatus Bathyarchaeia archaeon]
MDFREEIKPLVDQVRTWASAEPMTPLQRILALYDFKDPDKVPGGFAMWSPTCIGVTEVSAAEYHTDPYKFFYTQLTALNRYRHDLPILFSDVYNIEPEACSSKVMYPEHSMPEIKDFAIKEPRDLDALKVPDPHRDGRMPYILEICRLYHEHLSDLFYACPGGNAPFS